MEDAELVAGFEAADLGTHPFGHEQHLRVAWRYLEDLALPEAVARFQANLRRFAEKKGAHGLYHETLTWAYFVLLQQCRLSLDPASRTFEEACRIE